MGLVAISPSGAWWKWPHGQPQPLMIHGASAGTRLGELALYAGHLGAAHAALDDAKAHPERWEQWLQAVERVSTRFTAQALRRKGMDTTGLQGSQEAPPPPKSSASTGTIRVSSARWRCPRPELLPPPRRGYTDWMTRAQLAKAAGISPQWMTELVRQGDERIESARLSKTVRRELALPKTVKTLYRWRL